MKEQFVKAEMEIVEFDVEDIITTSTSNGQPPQPPWYDDELD